jgi:AcrR family transcriptional regulator
VVTERGVATRAKLIEATTQVERDVGYAHATTKAIAQAAGIAEGTIYRHYPDKASLFFAAVLDRNTAIVEELSRLPERAGYSTLEDNLIDALYRLAGLRDDILPLELAIATDPELAGRRGTTVPAPGHGALPGPPMFLAEYLAAEQTVGRIRAEVLCDEAAVVLLATLFGLALIPSSPGTVVDKDLLKAAVRNFVVGTGTPPR